MALLFISPLTYSLDKCMLRTRHMPDSVLDTGKPAASKGSQELGLLKLKANAQVDTCR